MSRIAACTNCRQQVTIPEDVDQGEQVRCPLCQADYPLSEVLAEAAEADDSPERPPELIPVAAVSDENRVPDSSEVEAEVEAQGEAEASEERDVEAGTSANKVEEAPETDSSESFEIDPEAVGSDDETDKAPAEIEQSDAESQEPAVEREEPAHETQPGAGESEQPARETEQPPEDAAVPACETPTPAAEDEIVRVRCPVCEAEHGLDRVIVVSTGAELGPAVARAVARAVLPGQTAPSDGPALDVWAKADGVPQIDLGAEAEVQAVTADAGAFDFAREESEAEEESAGVAGARPRRKRKKKSVLRMLVVNVFSGLAGLVIAYYILCWYRGEAGNFLHIPLPGVPHTYKYSPSWFPGWLKPDPEAEDVSSDEFADFEWPDIPAPPDVNQADEKPTSAPDQRESADLAASSTGSSPGAEGSGAAGPAPPKPEAFPEGYVGLVDPPSYSSDDLGEALKAAHESLTEASDPVSEETYRKLCRLAEVVTFVDSAPGAKQLGSRRSAVRKLLGQIGKDQANIDRIGFQAGALCVDHSGRGSGILLAGKVVKSVSDGNAHGSQVQLAASGRTILVAGDKPLSANEDDSVLILGSIVDNPAENLVGFTTQQPFVIWAGLTIRVEE